MKKTNGKALVIEEPDYKKIEYFRMFAARDCFRKSCYSCPHNTLERCSDFTTGNFWGIEKISRTFDTSKGVSMLLINTEKGELIFNQIKDALLIEQRTTEDAIAANDAIVKGCIYPPHRDAIYDCFQKKGFAKTIKKYYSPLSARNILTKLYLLKRKIFK